MKGGWLDCVSWLTFEGVCFVRIYGVYGFKLIGELFLMYREGAVSLKY